MTPGWSNLDYKQESYGRFYDLKLAFLCSLDSHREQHINEFHFVTKKCPNLIIMVLIVNILCYSAIKCAIITKFGTRIDCNVIYNN